MLKNLIFPKFVCSTTNILDSVFLSLLLNAYKGCKANRKRERERKRERDRETERERERERENQPL